jgi:hypothetical protein
MPAPDRLAELQRQRALLQEHLAWLEREIAAEMRGSPAASPASPSSSTGLPAQSFANLGTLPTSSVVATPASASLAAATGVSGPAAITSVVDPTLEVYRQDTASLKSDLRRGCLLYFGIAFALFAIAVTAFYFLYSRRVPRPERQLAPATETPTHRR